MTFIEAAIQILKENGNKPMLSSEIWLEIENQKLVNTNGKTPGSTLNRDLHRSELFTQSDTPTRFKLKDFLPGHIKETFIKNGFITMDMLKEILAKNNIKID